MSVKSLSDQQNPKFLKKRITLKYIDEEQMELFYKVLLSIAKDNGIAVEDGDIDYILGSDY
tara:strand:+ start:620 stop:802 length:183 start_codon:yes stop_codon:yes gene_type:complete